VLAAATIVVGAITWVATALPARRAARIDRILALRGN
jgi:ABC-type antimicrobial peptide transport system permease subunit